MDRPKNTSAVRKNISLRTHRERFEFQESGEQNCAGNMSEMVSMCRRCCWIKLLNWLLLTE